ncbi:uncharacterized protein LOC125842812 [Solanum stenotomum]|uniref:uncharacterized protein LOC125842812 n=1 Tax=Solanum stenotomum TaxID=172797 RepID=UPI0020D13B2F|nr:uncharacterized protein LOC125842812 [Solanum stenotomum]
MASPMDDQVAKSTDGDPDRREDDHEEDHAHLSESPKSKGNASSPWVNDLLLHILDKVEGSDDLLKGMKADFSSFNKKLNSHADAIKILEVQLSLLSTQLKPKLTMEDDDGGLAVVTRSGKVAIGDAMENKETQTHEEDKGMEEQEIAKGPQKEIEKHNPIPKVMHPLPKITPPFPQHLKKKNDDEKFKKFLSVFKTLSINLPLVEALLEMSGYAKFMKELVTKKKIIDFETIEVSHSCSAIMTKELIKKREDPGAFTIPYTIDMLQFAKALCDLGASINLMPYEIYKQLGLGEPKATTMRLLMEDRSIKYPVGILYDILVKVD